MLPSTLARPATAFGPCTEPVAAVAAAAQELTEATAEFDAALDQGCPMPVLVVLDREVEAAGRRHRAALARALHPA